MPFFGVPIRNGLPIGLGSVAGFGVQQFDPSQLFAGGTVAGAWYDPSDLTTLFTTSAGTTPVAMPGLGSAVSVGLMLDKSQGLVLGSEATSGAWLNTYTTTFDTFSSTGPNSFTATTTGAKTPRTRVDLSIPAAGWYVVQMTATFSGGSFTTSGPASSGNPYSPSIGVSTPTLSGVPFTTYFYATGPFSSFVLNWNASGASTLSVTGISVRELAGNHAIAFNNTTARPELRARVNLLTYSEQFDNGVWGKVGGIVPLVTVTANTTSAPNGTTTADTLNETVDNAYHSTYSTNTVTAGLTVVGSVCIKKSSVRYAQINYGGSVAGRWVQCVIDLDTGLITQSSAGAGGTLVSALSTPLGDDWYRVTLTGSVITDTTTYFYIGTVTSAAPSLNTFGLEVRAGNVSNSVFIWGADLRPANIGANVPAYQRIADANTYDTSGFPLYLRFDGIDDSMYTPANLNLSGTDKVAVFAGVRKLSDAAAGTLFESSANSATNAGAFSAFAPDSVSVRYGFYSRGTVAPGTSANTTSNTYQAPITNVLTGLGDISADQMILRLNASQISSVTLDQGAGNYGNYPLYIGSRNNGSVWFNGHLHSLIIAGSAVSASNISATEQWVAGKVGLVIP